MFRTENPPTFLRENYSPPNFSIQQSFLDFQLNPHKTIVNSRLKVQRLSAGSLKLHGEDLELLSLQVDGQEHKLFELSSSFLVIHDLPDHFDLEITCSNEPIRNTSLMGLYVSNGNFFTQCEAEGFRKITYFLDQPDVLSKFTVKLTAPKDLYPVLLSNGNLIHEEDLANGLHSATWEDPFLKPSYLFAIVAGKLSVLEQKITTSSGASKLLQVWVEEKDLPKTKHAMTSLMNSIAWDEKRFGLELDLDRFMIVAVGDFNMGAMENKGLNIFNTKYVLADQDTATDADFANIEGVVGHEYFHNWTGNRVTCRDWFQLSLKEGLTVFRDQEFSADMMGSDSGRAVKRIEDVRLLRQVQFPEDAGPMSHPIRPDSYQEINNFYTVTIYEKGAEVVRMQHTLLGESGFRKGMDLYFQRHDGQAVTCDDFVAAMADANQTDFTQFKRWYSQAGTPRVKVKAEYFPDKQAFQLHLEQSCDPTPGQEHKESFHIPLKAKLLIPNAPQDEFLIELKEDNLKLDFSEIPSKPILSINRDFSAPIILEFEQSLSDLQFLLAHDDNAFNRWEAGQKIMIRHILHRELPSDELVAIFNQILLDNSLDNSFKELMLTLPAETYLYEQLEKVNPQEVHESKIQFKKALARSLHSTWNHLYQSLQIQEEYLANAIQAGKRSLKNLALHMLIEENIDLGSELAYRQFKDSTNMTDRQSALVALVHHSSLKSTECLEQFYKRYKDDDLSIDKWFAIQASRPPEGDIKLIHQIKELKQHPDYKCRNPNRVRSLVHAFCLGNPAGFHDLSGLGYAFWVENVVELDHLNPQVAARLARALDRYKKFASPYQEMMKQALEDVASHSLSKDVSEVIQKALK